MRMLTNSNTKTKTMQDIKNKLEQCQTPREMLEYILANYELREKPGLITKATFVSGLMQALRMLNAKPKA